MRADLLDAQGSVDWAIAHAPALIERFNLWQQTQPYRVVTEPNPGGGQFIVAYPDKPLDPLIFGDVGAMINAIRSGLDVLMAALSQRNGVTPDRHTHFPVHADKASFLGDVEKIKNERRLSQSEADRIKTCSAYDGGDKVLYRLNRLDVVRKHHRFLKINPLPAAVNITACGGQPHLVRLQDKTILYYLPPGMHFKPHQGNTLMAAEITINEPALGLKDEAAVPLLRGYAARVSEVITLFDVS
jgi:hypothetical protein